MSVIKRDGTEVLFDSSKIKSAIKNANSRSGEMSEEDISKIVSMIESKCSKNDNINVEQIQDLVENTLLKSRFKETAKQYILYRDQRTRIRQGKSKLMKEVTEKLLGKNIVNSNANCDEASFGGRKGEAGNELTKQYALDYCMTKKTRENHLSNRIYVHDLDNWVLGTHNCLSIPFDDLLANGFNTRQSDIRPASSVNTAFQLLAVIFQLQSLQQFGGVSATHLDWTMVPYIRLSFYKHYNEIIDVIPFLHKKIELENPREVSIDDRIYRKGLMKRYIYKKALKLTNKELDQAVEGMYHNLNTLQSRSGNQLPFTSINYGTCTSLEGRMVIKSLLEGSIKGTGKHHLTPIFPCGIFQYMKGVNDKPRTPNYDLFKLAIKSTVKRLYPNYANVDWSNNAGYDRDDPKTYFSTMGCRTSNGADINAEPGVNPQTKDGRGNIAPTTIIMPTLAMEAKEEVEKDPSKNLVETFLQILDEAIHDAKDSLIERFEYICSQPPEAAKFMYENNTFIGYHPEEGIRSALKHGTLVIGQLGLAETLQILINTDHTSEAGMDLAKKIEQLFKDRCAEFKQTYRLNFGVYYTPAENLCYSAMKKFKARYGEIKNVSDREYFTNSIHVPVWKDIDAFTKIDIESQLTGYSNAGCITYVELSSSAKSNEEAVEELVRYAMEKDIPYFAINVPNDECADCGYTDEFNDHCPECGSTNILQLRRVTGYLTGNYKTAFNYGKQKEVEERVKHL